MPHVILQMYLTNESIFSFAHNDETVNQISRNLKITQFSYLDFLMNSNGYVND